MKYTFHISLRRITYKKKTFVSEKGLSYQEAENQLRMLIDDSWIETGSVYTNIHNGSQMCIERDSLFTDNALYPAYPRGYDPSLDITLDRDEV